LLLGLLATLLSRSGRAAGATEVSTPSMGGRRARAGRWNLIGLALSTAYLGWSAAAQHHVAGLVHAQLAQGPEATSVERVLVTPTPFNTALWRVVVMRPDRYEEGFYALADQGRPVRFRAYARDAELFKQVQAMEAVGHIAAFSRGFFRVDERDGAVRITDLRMGQEPSYVFSFEVARRGSALQPLQPTRSVGGRDDVDVAAGLRWLWARAGGQDLDPPGVRAPDAGPLSSAGLGAQAPGVSGARR